MNMPTRVVIADDHPFIRFGLRELLSSHEDIELVGEASDGCEAVALWQELRPDIGLFDLRMPTLDGVQALQRIREQDPQAAVIILTTLVRDVDIERALDAGARAYQCKDAATSELVACIRSVRAGAPQELDRMKSRLSSRLEDETLTARESNVLRRIAYGWTNQKVAEDLGIGEGTVKTHLKRVYDKLGAHNRTEAVAFARRKGLL
jgi:two-component system NarL family response regulator